MPRLWTTLNKINRDRLIKTRSSLATPDHSVHAWDLWENAGFREQDARKRVLAAKLKYEDRLRETDYGILTTDH